MVMIDDWRGFSDSAIREEETQALRDHGCTGHPLGSVTFVERLETVAGRRPTPHATAGLVPAERMILHYREPPQQRRPHRDERVTDFLSYQITSPDWRA